MWRVRRKNERGFDDGFHVQNGEGARQLVELLNKQDSELAAVTEQRDRLAEALAKVVKSWDESTWLDDNEFESFKEALQSLTTNEL